MNLDATPISTYANTEACVYFFQGEIRIEENPGVDKFLAFLTSSYMLFKNICISYCAHSAGYWI